MRVSRSFAQRIGRKTSRLPSHFAVSFCSLVVAFAKKDTIIIAFKLGLVGTLRLGCQLSNSVFLHYCWHACFAAAQPNAAHLPSDNPVA